MSIQETVWSALRGKGLPEKSVAAAMGNIEAESDFDQTQIEAGSGVGFGLCQWSYERRTQLEAYGTDLTHQINFLWAELSGNVGDTGASPQWTSKDGYISLPEFLSGNGSIADLTAAMCFCWERPNASVAHLERRQNAAQKYYNQFTGTTPTAASDTSSSNSVEIPSTDYEVVKGSEKIGDSLYGRRYRITVSDSSGNALNVSKLRCVFNIAKTILAEPNYSEISIYNLNAETENSIMLNATRVIVEAGYEGQQFGQIFDGDILQTIREKENGTDYKLTIIAFDSDRAINFDIANYSILKGQTSRQVVEHIVNSAKYPLSLGSISDALNDTQALARGKVIFGKSSDYLRQIAQSHNAHYYTESGKVNIIKMDDLPEGEIIDLSPTSGLVGTPEQTEYGISGQCLINPQIKVNTLIHVDNSLVRAMKIDINSGNSAPTTTTTTGDYSSTTTRNKIIAEAKKLCDDPNVGYSETYRNQTINGITYYDCSSFVKHCYEAAGLTIVDITEPQWADVSSTGQVVDQANARAGDIVFWFRGSDCYHVAIYDGAGGVYAARTSNAALADQVEHESLYGTPKFGRPKVLVQADNGQAPSAVGDTTTDTTNNNQVIFRGIDKDGIYRILSLKISGDTRGNDWYMNFTTCSQVGGAIPSVSS